MTAEAVIDDDRLPALLRDLCNPLRTQHVRFIEVSAIRCLDDDQIRPRRDTGVSSSRDPIGRRSAVTCGRTRRNCAMSEIVVRVNYAESLKRIVDLLVGVERAWSRRIAGAERRRLRSTISTLGGPAPRVRCTCERRRSLRGWV